MLLRAAAPGPVTKISMRCPNTVAADVISTGRRRVAAARRMAVILSTPCCCSPLANSTIRMPFLAIRPVSVIKTDLRVDVERGGFQRKIGSIAATSASGTEPRMMMNGSRKLLNCAASTRKIRTSASTAAFHRARPS
jgi:hypothetical protein